jgi:hypothetical protein
MLGSTTVDAYEIEYNAIIEGLCDGRVIPLLGAGFNLADRPEGVAWEALKSHFLPSGYELACHLAARYQYPFLDRDLARVCQFAVEVRGLAPLYNHLRSLFERPCEVTSAHRFLASLPARLRARKYPKPNLLIVSTNYDDLVEAAFAEAGERLEVVSYIADAKSARGKFAHHMPDGERRIITRPNEYADLSPLRCCILLKIHGDFDPAGAANDSFVITEDHYIDFLTRTDLSNLVPVLVAAQLRASHFLFMGYSLRDWNLRVILHRIWDEQRLGYNSWAIQRSSDPLDRRFWSRRNVEILEAPLSDALERLSAKIDALDDWS